MSKLTDDDRAFCASHGMNYIPPDPPISLEQFEADGPYFQNQGPANPHEMWTPGAGRYSQDKSTKSDTTTSKSEWAGIGVVALILVSIAMLLAH